MHDWDSATHFMILLDGDVPTDDWRELLAQTNALGEDVKVSPTPRLLIEIALWVSIFTDNVKATEYAAAMVKILQQWVAKMRQKRIEPAARLVQLEGGVTVNVDTDVDVDVTTIVRRKQESEPTDL